MARSARQQRRQRRAAQLEPAAAGIGAPPAAPPRPVRSPDDEPERRRSQPAVRAEPKQRFRFIRESWAELKKVDWPGRNQVTQGTIVVIVACAIVGAYLWLLDLGMKQVVENIILRGT